ncbi:MAG: hypothetical protein ABF596_06570, partial [Liquorilactobacillus satsumensis]
NSLKNNDLIEIFKLNTKISDTLIKIGILTFFNVILNFMLKTKIYHTHQILFRTSVIVISIIILVLLSYLQYLIIVLSKKISDKKKLVPAVNKAKYLKSLIDYQRLMYTAICVLLVVLVVCFLKQFHYIALGSVDALTVAGFITAIIFLMKLDAKFEEICAKYFTDNYLDYKYTVYEALIGKADGLSDDLESEYNYIENDVLNDTNSAQGWINWRILFSAAIGFLFPAILFTIVFVIENGDYGSLANWVSGIGSISTAVLSLMLAFDKSNSEKKEKALKLEHEISKLDRISESIKTARSYEKKDASYTLKEVWKDQMPNLFMLFQILTKECYSAEANSVKLFIEYINNHDNNQLNDLNDQLARPMLKLGTIINEKNKVLRNKYGK